MHRRRAGVGEGRRGGTIPLRGGGCARVVSVAEARPLVITAAHRGAGRWGLGWKRRRVEREAGARRRVSAAAAAAGLGCSALIRLQLLSRRYHFPSWAEVETFNAAGFKWIRHVLALALGVRIGPVGPLQAWRMSLEFALHENFA